MLIAVKMPHYVIRCELFVCIHRFKAAVFDELEVRRCCSWVTAACAHLCRPVDNSYIKAAPDSLMHKTIRVRIKPCNGCIWLWQTHMVYHRVIVFLNSIKRLSLVVCHLHMLYMLHLWANLTSMV